MHNFKFSKMWISALLGMPKFGLVRFSGVFAWTANQNQTVGRGCVEPWTGPAELGSNLVWTELNLQFFVDVLSGEKECGEVLTSVCYVGKHAGGTFQVRNTCFVIVSIWTAAWHWWCRYFRVGLHTVYHIYRLYGTHKRLQDPYRGHSVAAKPINHGWAQWSHTGRHFMG